VEEMKKILHEYPYWSEGMIPAGTYKYVTENIRLIAFNNIFVCDKDLGENIVYTLTKATFDYHADLAKIHPIMKEIKLEGIKESPVPLHPGAARYFKEKGITIPDKILPR